MIHDLRNYYEEYKVLSGFEKKLVSKTSYNFYGFKGYNQAKNGRKYLNIIVNSTVYAILNWVKRKGYILKRVQTYFVNPWNLCLIVKLMHTVLTI